MSVLKSFFASEDGAVTVDWVVLTAAVVVVSALVIGALQDPIDNEIAVIAGVVENTN